MFRSEIELPALAETVLVTPALLRAGSSHGTLAPNEGAGYDLIDSKGGKWEVRSITKGGIYFSPSYMVGSGRSFGEHGFLEKIKELKGFIVSDVESFPDVPFWIIASEKVLEWWKNGELGSTTKISREKALRLISSIEKS